MPFTTKEYQILGFSKGLAYGNAKEHAQKTSQLATYINNGIGKPLFDRYIAEAQKSWTGKESKHRDNHNRIRNSISNHVITYFNGIGLDYNIIRNDDRIDLRRQAAIIREKAKRARSGSSSTPATLPYNSSTSPRIPPIVTPRLPAATAQADRELNGIAEGFRGRYGVAGITHPRSFKFKPKRRS